MTEISELKTKYMNEISELKTEFTKEISELQSRAIKAETELRVIKTYIPLQVSAEEVLAGPA